MSDTTPSLTIEDTRHVAHLARLNLSEEELKSCQHDLTAILDHVATLGDLDLTDVEPMAHPGDQTNRLDPDDVQPSFKVEQVLNIAPATEGDFIAVPKVLGDTGGSA